MSAYVFESPEGPVELSAPDDVTACHNACAWLQARGWSAKGLSMFRYPLFWVDRTPWPKARVTATAAELIWVPLFTFLGKA